ncbi:hypothetical protein SeMB42_g02096 [Synchytrium endobioticum]|uniref:TFIIS-type domain-containing protein n=1 Tax=Synchytrium endobioticum TaxID=286115 RepID=A0A507D9W8_9FUNG|nr:hypothetical protein SeLEV6574_g02582 [Synchytrium endobioticum]TPX50869.1 hypothetical protein SeMB42_g02096 [Synchytrium endobioticum]
MSTKYDSDSSNLYCKTCPYVHRVTQKQRVFMKHVIKDRKKVDDVFDSEWRGAQTTKVACQKCSYGEAAFIEFQIRSADEPMTQFFKCMGCNFQWREN